MDTDLLILVTAFFLIAIVYSSVGFGGGSSYLALLAITGVDFEILRPTALLCNIIVVAGGTYVFWRSGVLDLKKSWPFLCLSIPMAFIGGLWEIRNTSLFFILLGICLLLAAVLLWVQPAPMSERKTIHPLVTGALGGGIGFLSGLVGIGGGIFLSPVLNLFKWDKPKKIAALASLFILVNSVSGLAGQLTKAAYVEWRFIVPLLVAVFIGGQIGTRLGARRFHPLYIKRITALVVFVAAIKILRDYL
jgi:uncharacterized membrane protein YfcA